MRKRPAKLIAKIFSSIVVAILFLTVAELIIYVFLPLVKPPSRVFFNPFASEENRDAHTREAFVSSYYLEDPELFWRLNPGGEITEEGFRARRLYGEKKESIYRIVALGDSCTFGVGAGDMDSSYPVRLELILKSCYNENGVEVINAGVPGYASLQGLRYLKRILPRYKPDLVIIQFLHNDGVRWLNQPDSRIVVPGESARKIQMALRKWRLYELMRRGILWLKGYLAGRPLSAGASPYRVSPEEYKRNLTEMAGLAEEEGAAVIFLVPPALPPYRFREDFTDYRDATIASASETGAHFIDLTETLDSFDDPGSFFWRPGKGDLGHLNSIGYALQAEKVAGTVKKIMDERNP